MNILFKNNIIKKYLVGSFLYGVGRTMYYDNIKETELYTQKLYYCILNGTSSIILTPHALFEDITNIEAKLRNKYVSNYALFLSPHKYDENRKKI